jgi:hypothetical protein
VKGRHLRYIVSQTQIDSRCNYEGMCYHTLGIVMFIATRIRISSSNSGSIGQLISEPKLHARSLEPNMSRR